MIFEALNIVNACRFLDFLGYTTKRLGMRSWILVSRERQIVKSGILDDSELFTPN